ncbi:hypothetical protein ACB092_07G091800 [Castanea dentata]
MITSALVMDQVTKKILLILRNEFGLYRLSSAPRPRPCLPVLVFMSLSMLIQFASIVACVILMNVCCVRFYLLTIFVALHACQVGVVCLYLKISLLVLCLWI